MYREGSSLLLDMESASVHVPCSVPMATIVAAIHAALVTAACTALTAILLLLILFIIVTVLIARHCITLCSIDTVRYCIADCCVLAYRWVGGLHSAFCGLPLRRYPGNSAGGWLGSPRSSLVIRCE